MAPSEDEEKDESDIKVYKGKGALAKALGLSPIAAYNDWSRGDLFRPCFTELYDGTINPLQEAAKARGGTITPRDEFRHCRDYAAPWRNSWSSQIQFAPS